MPHNIDIEKLVRRQILLQILRRALEWDRQQLKTARMYKVYDRLIDRCTQKISRDLHTIKKQLQAEQVTIVQEEQRKQMRNVLYKHKGYIITTVFDNYLTKLE